MRLPRVYHRGSTPYAGQPGMSLFGEVIVVSLPGARIEHVTERIERLMGHENGGFILVHIGTNNADNEGTTSKYRHLLKRTKQTRIGQIISSGI